MATVCLILLGALLGIAGLLVLARFAPPTPPRRAERTDRARLRAVRLAQLRAEQQLDRSVQDTVAELLAEARRGAQR